MRHNGIMFRDSQTGTDQSDLPQAVSLGVLVSILRGSVVSGLLGMQVALLAEQRKARIRMRMLRRVVICTTTKQSGSACVLYKFCYALTTLDRVQENSLLQVRSIIPMKFSNKRNH